ncbi:hypothetical protein VTK73DRAFT_10303 [Phialemonium thermophilum]|uniref:Uncharacterized protein n=1 Tax=Phialemonium thermophilum TaxID=223376 RepID=A0ABR3VXC2_9PEZI
MNCIENFLGVEILCRSTQRTRCCVVRYSSIRPPRTAHPSLGNQSNAFRPMFASRYESGELTLDLLRGVMADVRHKYDETA